MRERCLTSDLCDDSSQMLLESETCVIFSWYSFWTGKSFISTPLAGINATSRSWRWNRQVQCLHHVYSQWWIGGVLLLNNLASSVIVLPQTIQNVGKPCAVYAGNLSWSTTEEQLLSFGGGDRGAISAEIKRHKDTKRSKGWGYGLNHP